MQGDVLNIILFFILIIIIIAIVIVYYFKNRREYTEHYEKHNPFTGTELNEEDEVSSMKKLNGDFVEELKFSKSVSVSEAVQIDVKPGDKILIVKAEDSGAKVDNPSKVVKPKPITPPKPVEQPPENKKSLKELSPDLVSHVLEDAEKKPSPIVNDVKKNFRGKRECTECRKIRDTRDDSEPYVCGVCRKAMPQGKVSNGTNK